MENIIIKKIPKNGAVPFHLLLLADPSETLVRKYLEVGEIWGAYLEEQIIGVYILIKKNSETREIINIAVDENFQGKGIGKILINDAIAKAKLYHAKKLEIGTGNSSIAQLALYQKCGFVVESIDKNFFSKHYNHPIIENGIVCKDMVRLGIKIE